MSNTIQSPVTELLQHHAIPYEVITIPLSDDNKPIRQLEELLKEQGRDPNSVVRSLLFRSSSEKYVLLAATGGGRADWAALRQAINERKLTMADFDQVESVTGYVVGAVPPVALPETITLLIDQNITQYDTVMIGSGVLGYALSLARQDLQSLMSHGITGTFLKA